MDEYLKLSFHSAKSEIDGFNTDIKTNFDDSIGKVKVLTHEFSRVILNIINNACYALHKKKETLGDTFSPLIEVNTKKENDYISINIRDNGPGMPDNVKNQVFNPFFTTKPTGEGTGLGLSISYDTIVNGHGGKIEVHSEEGQFTEFEIMLPVSKD